MKQQDSRGVSSIEFAFSMLVILPLLLGTGVTGANMIRTLQTTQLARDAGHMYGRGLDFSQPGNQTILQDLGANVGLTDSTGNAVVILSKVTYVDKPACAAQGLADASGNPTSACVNYQHWVFAQRIQLGNTAVRGSNFGTASGVTCRDSRMNVNNDPNNCNIDGLDQATKSGDRASISGVNPYSVSAGGAVSGLPSGQVLYVAEAGARGFNMPPFVSNMVAYSFGLF